MSHSANSAHRDTLAELADNPVPEHQRWQSKREALADLLRDGAWHLATKK